MKTLLLALLSFASAANAECFEIGNISGVSMNNADFYKPIEDSFGDRTLRLTISGDAASVEPNGLECSALLDNMAFCIGGSDDMPGLTTEAYTVERASSRVILTQTRSGFVAPFEGFNGGKVMVGDIIGTCDEPKK